MRAAASQLGIDVDIRDAEASHDKAIAYAKYFLKQTPPPDYLIAVNNQDVAADIIRLVGAGPVKLILVNADLDEKDWAAFGEPRTKYPSWLGSLIPDHEGAGYDIGIAILTEAARIRANRPLRILGLTGETNMAVAESRALGLKRAIGVMTKALGPKSIELVEVKHLDWSRKSAEAFVHGVIQTGPHIDALWAANDPMALGAIDAFRAGGYRPGTDVLVGGLNWSQEAIDRVLNGDMVVTHGGHFLLGAWSMVVLRDYHDGRDFAEEDVRLPIPMGAIDLAVARRFPAIGKVDWRQVDFTRFSKTLNPAIKSYEFTPDAVLRQLPSVQ
jgi:ABC-type sugar transport system substrate-binding protein